MKDEDKYERCKICGCLKLKGYFCPNPMCK